MTSPTHHLQTGQNMTFGSQRYTSPVAHERMERGQCPECGRTPAEHWTVGSMHAMFDPVCNLLKHGVVDRIEQYRADRAALDGADQ